jgi:acetyl-CoA synthetase
LNLWATGRDVLDFRSGETYWCTADPAWVTGTAYGIVAPLLHGLTVIADAEPFDVGRWYRTLEEEKVAILYTSPTALRRLMRAGGCPRRRHDFSSLRHIFSVGEPLNPELIRWSREALGLPVYDTWWQTETGAIAIANTPARPIRPGSMGLPVRGMEAAVVRRLPGGGIEPITQPGLPGEIALRTPWPSLFREYWHDHQGSAACFSGGWYLTGDLARRDADGYFWFTGRADDIIKTGGHQVSPFEVESTLLEHPAVAESAAVGLPDRTIGWRVAAFVTLRRGMRPDEPLRQELLAFGRQRLGPAAAPREIHFRARLPRNRAGKILRRRIREKEGKSHDDP